MNFINFILLLFFYFILISLLFLIFFFADVHTIETSRHFYFSYDLDARLSLRARARSAIVRPTRAYRRTLRTFIPLVRGERSFRNFTFTFNRKRTRGSVAKCAPPQPCAAHRDERRFQQRAQHRICLIHERRDVLSPD